MISDPKYSFPVHKKIFFVVTSKVSIFHQILPNYYSHNHRNISAMMGGAPTAQTRSRADDLVLGGLAGASHFVLK